MRKLIITVTKTKCYNVNNTILLLLLIIIIIIKRQFIRRRNMSVDITRAPYRQNGNVVRDSSTDSSL